jgi:hypothetical protein
MKKLSLIPLLLIVGCVVVTDHPRHQPQVVVDVHSHWRVVWVEYYGCPDLWIDTCVGMGWHDDDVSVALFLAHHARVDINVVIGHRRAGLSWWSVGLKLNLSPMIFHVEIPSHVHVGPPYGNAYGYYRKHNPNYVFVDADVHNLVHLRVTSHYYGLDPIAVIRAREGGKPFGDIVKENHGKSKGKDVSGKPVKQDAPKGKGPDVDKGKGPDGDKGPGPGKGKGKNK